MKAIVIIAMLALILVAVPAQAETEYRLTLIVGYPSAGQRDAAVEAMKARLAGITDKASGAKAAEVIRDEYPVPVVTATITKREPLQTGE